MTTQEWIPGDRCKVILQGAEPIIVGFGHIASVLDFGPIKPQSTIRVIFDDPLVMGGTGTGWFSPDEVVPE
jgi:hypothetical protein